MSSAVTADDVSRALAGNHEFSTTRVQQLEMLKTSLMTLTAALYQRAAERDATVLDDSVRMVLDAARGAR